MKRSEIVEKEAVQTDDRKDGVRNETLRISCRNDGQNEVKKTKKGASRVKPS